MSHDYKVGIIYVNYAKTNETDYWYQRCRLAPSHKKSFDLAVKTNSKYKEDDSV